MKDRKAREPRKQDKEEAEPTLKELMTGTVLDGYIEAGRTKTLREFSEKDEDES